MKDTADSYFFATLSLDCQMEFMEAAVGVAKEVLTDIRDPDKWEALAWVFAQRADKLTNEEYAATALGLAGGMFAEADRLRSPVKPS
jgi:hypothetical protein